MLEVEQKFRIHDLSGLLRRLSEQNFVEDHVEQHVDTYLRHPARDFAVSGEALRIRQIGDQAYITYKGKRHAGIVKVRPEIELPIGGETSDWLEIWQHLGFQVAEQVRKSRRVMRATAFPGMIVAVDSVERLGDFVEIEVLIESTEQEVHATQRVTALANLLELDQVEPRSYLRQILEQLPS